MEEFRFCKEDIKISHPSILKDIICENDVYKVFPKIYHFMIDSHLLRSKVIPYKLHNHQLSLFDYLIFFHNCSIRDEVFLVRKNLILNFFTATLKIPKKMQLKLINKQNLNPI